MKRGELRQLIKEEYLLMESSDAENPEYLFSTVPTKLVQQIATGKVDANEYAKREMANRGFDKRGKWIGFDAAKKLWGVK